MRFEWDPRKAASNKRKHGVAFEEAATCFADPFAVLLEERKNPGRMILIGVSSSSRLIFTVYVELADDEIRIISARRSTRRERSYYENDDDEAP